MRIRAAVVLFASLVVASLPAPAATFRVLAWNNLGMHCMDDDFSVFSLLPPFNTLEAQVIRDGALVTDSAGLVVTYRAIADPDGSINATSAGKTNFWDHAFDLFGASLAVDAGLAGNAMPGAANTPRAMAFDAARAVWSAAGIPITPIDDDGQANPYPLMRVEVRDAATSALQAQLDVVLPVSDEMDCRGCHASGASAAAKPAEGWVMDPDPARDHRLNILRLHDQRHRFEPLYATLLAERGYAAGGLFDTVQQNGVSILCAGCHVSEALPGSGAAGVDSLTRVMHKVHTRVRDPKNDLPLDDSTNRAACYNCHPGSETRCLRGAMGSAVAADGTLAIQCQDCHGSMSDVRVATRTGWLDEPACQNCHTGTATQNSGAIRFTSVFDAPGHRRLAANDTFATTPDVPAPPWSLYRFSTGHGGLQCEACHDSTHAESPSSHRNDNLKAIALQGHEGMISQCNTCHTAGVPSAAGGGPHGMHPMGANWVENHGDSVEQNGLAACRNCHGGDDRGTVLSRAFANRSFSNDFGTQTFWPGFQVSCYACHNGPNSENATTNHAAQVSNTSAETTSGQAVSLPLFATDADGDPLVLRVVSQPDHGTVGMSGTTATFRPDSGFTGAQSFTFAANDGKTDSNLATASISIPEPGAVARTLVAALGLAALARRRSARVSARRRPAPR